MTDRIRSRRSASRATLMPHLLTYEKICRLLVKSARRVGLHVYGEEHILEFVSYIPPALNAETGAASNSTLPP